MKTSKLYLFDTSLINSVILLLFGGGAGGSGEAAGSGSGSAYPLRVNVLPEARSVVLKHNAIEKVDDSGDDGDGDTRKTKKKARSSAMSMSKKNKKVKTIRTRLGTTLTLDGRCVFECADVEIVVLIRLLKGEIDNLLADKVTQSGADHGAGDGEVVERAVRKALYSMVFGTKEEDGDASEDEDENQSR
eukprot:g13943.t1